MIKSTQSLRHQLTTFFKGMKNHGMDIITKIPDCSEDSIEGIISEIADNIASSNNNYNKMFDSSWDLYISGYTHKALQELGTPSDLPDLLIGAMFLKFYDLINNNINVLLEDYIVTILELNNIEHIKNDTWELLIELTEEEYQYIEDFKEDIIDILEAQENIKNIKL